MHAAGSQTFTWVLGQWNVPDVAPAAEGRGDQYSFAWIGIDGNTDVTQIGTLQSVSADANGNLSKNCYAWFEWFPNSFKAITNLPVSFGDTMLGLICMDSPTEAFFNLLNLTSGIHAGFIFTAPSGTVSLENQAEWILERPEIGNQSANAEFRRDLLRFGHGRAWPGLSRRRRYGHGDNIVENGVTVATTTVETPTLIKIAYTGLPPFGSGQLLSYGTLELPVMLRTRWLSVSAGGRNSNFCSPVGTLSGENAFTQSTKRPIAVLWRRWNSR